MRKHFREQRLRRGWTQRELAERCRAEGASADDSNLSKVERGLLNPGTRLRPVLCRLLDLPISYFDADDEQRKEAA